MQKNNGSWGHHEGASGKKIKQQSIFQNIFKEGNWGNGPSKNLGLLGFRGTPEENAAIGKIQGGKK